MDNVVSFETSSSCEAFTYFALLYSELYSDAVHGSFRSLRKKQRARITSDVSADEDYAKSRRV